MVCAHHARPQPAQPARGKVPHPEQYLVDRICRGGRHPPGYLPPLRRLRYDDRLDRSRGKRISPPIQYSGRSLVEQPPIGTAFWQRNSKLNNRENTQLKSVMDFRFMGLSQSAFFEETGEWNGGLHAIYDHMTYDFIYPDIHNVLRFLDNHDTDRFLKEYPGGDLSGWKQAITFLLTMPGTPQLYYGTELLMHGNKSRSDGDIRLDVPGGWPGGIRPISSPGKGATSFRTKRSTFSASCFTGVAATRSLPKAR